MPIETLRDLGKRWMPRKNVIDQDSRVADRYYFPDERPGEIRVA